MVAIVGEKRGGRTAVILTYCKIARWDARNCPSSQDQQESNHTRESSDIPG